MRRMLCILLMVCLIVNIVGITAASYTVTDYGLPAQGTRMTCNGDDVLLYRYDGDTASLTSVTSSLSRTVNVGYGIADMGIFGDTAVMVCNDSINNQLIVYTYAIYDDILDSFVVRDMQLRRIDGFGYDGSFYLISGSNVLRYTDNGTLDFTYRFSSSIASLTADFDGCIYAVCQNTLYLLSGGFFTLSGVSMASPVTFVGDKIFCDEMGRLASVQGYSTAFLSQPNLDCTAACMLNGYAIAACGHTLYACVVSTGSAVMVCELPAECGDVRVLGDTLYALTEDGRVMRVSIGDFSVINTADAIRQSTGSNDITRSGISSVVYGIDTERYHITGIPAGTNVTTFRQAISYDGYTLTLLKNGGVYRSGKVGTAMRAEFAGSDTYTFELSVVGDLTGEGNVNTRDIYQLMDFLLSTVVFDGVYLTSADINADGRIDTLDLVLMLDLKNGR